MGSNCSLVIGRRFSQNYGYIRGLTVRHNSERQIIQTLRYKDNKATISRDIQQIRSKNA